MALNELRVKNEDKFLITSSILFFKMMISASSSFSIKRFSGKLAILGLSYIIKLSGKIDILNLYLHPIEEYMEDEIRILDPCVCLRPI